MSDVMLAMRLWSRRQWLVALVATIVTMLAVALPTAVIPNPVFGRAIEVTWWSYPVVLITGVLGGLLVATYIRTPSTDGDAETPPGADAEVEADRPMKLAAVGGLVTFFAVGCPVCNKVVLLAIGASGAVSWFAPVQPILALASIVLLAWALRTRLLGQVSCAVPETTDRTPTS